MNYSNQLKEENYCVVRNFLSEEKAIKLGEEFVKFCDDNDVGRDGQVKYSQTIQNYDKFLQILCEKTKKVGKIVGQKVLPTYTHARVYRKHANLIPHKDRPECEISLTINLDSDQPWPIWIETPNGVRCVDLGPGDAMFYHGCEALHWRDEFTGTFCAQVFLHYVYTNGPNRNCYFDYAAAEYKSINLFDTNETVQRNLDFYESQDEELQIQSDSYGIDNQDTTKENLDELVEEISNMKYITSDEYGGPETKVEDYIMIIEGHIPPSVCDGILEPFGDDHPDWEQTIIGPDIEEPRIRGCKQILVSGRDTEPHGIVDRTLFNYVQDALKEYKNYYPAVMAVEDQGYSLLRYRTGDEYKQHIDSSKITPRELSCSFILNDDFEGGEFSFFDGMKTYKLNKGDAILFPSNFMFPHQVLPVTSGTRYAMVTWFL